MRSVVDGLVHGGVEAFEPAAWGTAGAVLGPRRERRGRVELGARPHGRRRSRHSLPRLERFVLASVLRPWATGISRVHEADAASCRGGHAAPGCRPGMTPPADMPRSVRSSPAGSGGTYCSECCTGLLGSCVSPRGRCTVPRRGCHPAGDDAGRRCPSSRVLRPRGFRDRPQSSVVGRRVMEGGGWGCGGAGRSGRVCRGSGLVGGAWRSGGWRRRRTRRRGRSGRRCSRLSGWWSRWWSGCR